LQNVVDSPSIAFASRPDGIGTLVLGWVTWSRTVLNLLRVNERFLPPFERIAAM